MADSKISHLTQAPYLLDSDLMVVVTGTVNQGSYPQTCSVPVSYIRRYITRLDLLVNTTSGIDSYYRPDLNILNIAATGLNAYGNNLINITYDDKWPYSGIISTTGLNVDQSSGNLITTQVQNFWPYKHTIHTTGLNALDGDNIGYCINNQWPYKYRFNTVSRSKHTNNSLTISNTNNIQPHTQSVLDSDLKISYGGFFLSKGYQTLNLLTHTKFRISSISASAPSIVAGLGFSNDRKVYELRFAPTSVNYTYRYFHNPTVDPFDIRSENRTKSNISILDWEPLGYNYVDNSCVFTINTSGNSSAGLQDVATFRNSGSNFYSVNYGSIGNSLFPIEYDAVVKPYLDNYLETTSNTTGPQYNLTNIQYSRQYRILLDTSPVDGPIYYTYTSNGLYAPTSASIHGNRYFSTTNIVSSDSCVGNSGSVIHDEDPTIDNYVTGGYFNSGILTLTRQGLSDLNISIPISTGGGGESDGNNYSTFLNFNNLTRELNLGRYGLPLLSVNIPDSNTNASLSFNNINRNLTLQRSGLPDLVANIPAVSSANNIRTFRTVNSNMGSSTLLDMSDEVVFVQLVSSGMTLALPSADIMSGRTISVKLISNPNGKQCSISGINSNTIDNKTTHTLYHEQSSASIYSDSVNWWLI